jgi:vacuolar-type H+-ATPase subunit I/STV1
VELWCLMPLLTIFQLYHGYLVLLVEYTKKTIDLPQVLTNLINNVVSSNKGVLIADIYIRTTVYINLKNIPHSPEGTPGYRNRI